MFKYSVNLMWNEEDGCYLATVSEFPGLSAFGETPEEATREARFAVEGFLKVYAEDGCPPPPPEIAKPFSGQTRLRLPRGLHASLTREAQNEGLSLNSYIIYLLSERHVARKIEGELTDLKYMVASGLLRTATEPKPRSDVHMWRHDINLEDVNIKQGHS